MDSWVGGCCGRFSICGLKGAADGNVVAGLAFELRLCSTAGAFVLGSELSRLRICCGTNIFGSGLINEGDGPREVPLRGW